MKKNLFVIAFYLIGFLLIILAHRIDPTNLAGPGLDFWFYVPIVIISFFYASKKCISIF